MDKPTKFISLGPGLAAPAAIKYRCPVSFTDRMGNKQRYDVEAEVVFEEGRYVCDRLTIRRQEGGAPVTTEGIRAIPVAMLLHVAVESWVAETTPTEDGGYRAAWPHWPVLPGLSERAKAGGGPSDEDLRTIATAYQVAYATGAAPTKTVMQRFELPRSTASRWIRMARERGLLGPATPRKAGG